MQSSDLDPPENIEPEDMESCLDGTLAYTVQTDMTVGTGFYQIQICPLFLAYAMPLKNA